jgi:hypothetical protein
MPISADERSLLAYVCTGLEAEGLGRKPCSYCLVNAMISCTAKTMHSQPAFGNSYYNVLYLMLCITSMECNSILTSPKQRLSYLVRLTNRNKVFFSFGLCDRYVVL